MILGRNPCTGINHKNNHVSLRHCLTRLFGHFLVNATRGVRLKSTGVDDDELVFSLPGISIVSVTRQSSIVSDDGVTTFGDAIEQRRLAYVRAPYHGLSLIHI